MSTTSPCPRCASAWNTSGTFHRRFGCFTCLHMWWNLLKPKDGAA